MLFIHRRFGSYASRPPYVKSDATNLVAGGPLAPMSNLDLLHVYVVRSEHEHDGVVGGLHDGWHSAAAPLCLPPPPSFAVPLEDRVIIAVPTQDRYYTLLNTAHRISKLK